MSAVYDLALDQGATTRFEIIFKDRTGGTDDAPTYTPRDLRGYTAKLQLRRHHGAPKLLELSTEDGGLTLGGLAGTIDVVFSAEKTEELENVNACLYDLELYAPSGDVIRLLQGPVTVSLNITE